MAQSGSYPKGIAKREEILETALQLIGERGYNAATIRELAEAVNLSKTGLLHHFGTKEELFAEILRRRDQRDLESVATASDVAQAVVEAIRHNAEVPGLVQLYSRFSAEATAADHAAHAYVGERQATLRSEFARLLTALQDSGRIGRSIDVVALAPVLLAAIDGLQTQWLFNDDVDMPAAFQELLNALLSTGTANPSEPERLAE